MKRIYARPAVLAILVALPACGGGGGGSVASGAPVMPVSQPTAAPMGQTVSIPIHGPIPAAIAYQAGKTGNWTALSASGGNVMFTLPIGTTSYGIAAMCPPNATGTSPFYTSPAEVVIEATTSDSPALFCRSTVAATVLATMIVETSAFPNTDTFSATQLVSYGNGPAFGSPAGADAIGSPLWQPGSNDFLLEVTNATTLLAARIVRNTTLTSAQTLTLAPMSPSADAVTMASLSYTAPAGGSLLNFWVTAEGQIALMGAGASGTLPLIPNASARSGDYYEGAVTGTVGGQFAVGAAASNTPASLSPSLPSSAFTVPPVTPAALPSANLAFNGFTVSGKRYYSLVLSYASPVAHVAAGAPLETVTASQSYLGTSTVVSTPDLSSIPGMLPKPASGTAVNVIGTDYVATTTMPWDDMEAGNAFFFAPLAPNAQFQAIQSQYTINFNVP